MSFLDRYEFEQILDEDLAVSRNQWQAETVKISPPQLSVSITSFKINFIRIILLSITAATVGFTLLHQPSFASDSKAQSSQTVLIAPTNH